MKRFRLIIFSLLTLAWPFMANAMDMRCQSRIGENGPQTTCSCAKSESKPILVGDIELGLRQVYQTFSESVNCPRSMVQKAHDEFISSQLAPRLNSSSAVDFVYQPPAPQAGGSRSGIWQSQISAEVTSALIGIWNAPQTPSTRELMQHMRDRTPIPNELVQQVQNWQAQQRNLDRELSKIEEERLEMMDQMSSFLQGLNDQPVLPMHLRPTPVPRGVSVEKAMAPLKELNQALDNQDALKGAREVNKLLKRIAASRRQSHERELSNFLESELKRKLINNSGLITSLPYTATPTRAFRSRPWSARGVQLASVSNKLLAAQSTLSKSLKHHCADGTCKKDKRAQLGDQKLHERSKTLMRTLSLSDSLHGMGQKTQKLEALVEEEIDHLESLATKKNPEQALYEYLDSVPDYQGQIIEELQSLDYERMFAFSRPLEFSEDEALLLNATKKDKLLQQSAKLSECTTSLELCRNADQLIKQETPIITDEQGDETIESKVHRDLKEH